MNPPLSYRKVKQAISLRKSMGYTFAEIAREIGSNAKTVWQYLTKLGVR